MYAMYFLALCVFGVLASVQAKCDAGCNVPVRHYKEMNCEPVFAKPDDCCPTHYNCAKIDGRAADKCYYKESVLNKGDQIDTELTSKNCLAACFCSKSEWEDITCASIDCPEFFGHTPLQPGCYRAYDQQSCCAKKTVCPPFDKLAKCEVNGKTYHEGQRFEGPEGTFLNCICQQNFEGKFVEPFCTEISCAVELRSTVNIRNKCAPVFYGSKGCPIQWQCSQDTDIIEVAEKPSANDKKCNYGSKVLNVGDKVILKRDSVHSPEINCECRIPPLVTCVQKPYQQK